MDNVIRAGASVGRGVVMMSPLSARVGGRLHAKLDDGAAQQEQQDEDEQQRNYHHED